MSVRLFLAVSLSMLAACSAQDDKVPSALQGPPNEAEIISGRCPSKDGPGKTVDLSDLANFPDKHDGQNVIVSGYFYASFERSAMYAKPTDDQVSVRPDESVWVDGISARTDTYARFMTVYGTFSTKEKGHGNLWPGSICATRAVYGATE